LDEPLSNLDAQLRIEMRYEIRKLVKANGLTAIYVTHDQEEALAMADRIAILVAGRVAQIGPAEEIYRSPHSAVVAAFIGETNLIDGEIVAVNGRMATVATAAGVMTGRLADPDWQPVVGMLVELSIRPEAWRLHKESGDNAVSGKITERSYLGQRIQYRIETAAGLQQVVEMNPHFLHQPGEDSIQLHARAEDVVVLNDLRQRDAGRLKIEDRGSSIPRE
jgi:iron(III) transport system ATP-binding protein